MRITFLGTAGGRIAMMTQIRGTGGFVIEMDGEMIHVDPGPGTLVRAKQHHVNLQKLTGIVISHAHPDHCTDAEVVIESMTKGTRKRGGTVIGGKFLAEGNEKHKRAISPFHAELPDKISILKAGESASIGKIKVTAIPTMHGEEDCFGFVFEGSKKIGYTSDGEYFEGQEDHFRGCDCLIVNVLRPRGKSWPHHMDILQAKKLIGLSKPGLAILTAFGMYMIRGNPHEEAKWTEKETGVKTVAARDGQVIELDNKGDEKSLRKRAK